MILNPALPKNNNDHNFFIENSKLQAHVGIKLVYCNIQSIECTSILILKKELILKALCAGNNTVFPMKCY